MGKPTIVTSLIAGFALASGAVRAEAPHICTTPTPMPTARRPRSQRRRPL